MMILFTSLLIASAIAMVILGITGIVGGTIFAIVFGDLMVCGLIIWFIYHILTKKKS